MAVPLAATTHPILADLYHLWKLAKLETQD